MLEHRRLYLLVAILYLVLLGSLNVAGCGEDSEGDATTSTALAGDGAVPSTAGVDPTSGGAATTNSLSSSETDLGNGRIRAGGFVSRAYEESGERLIDIDYADFLTGDEAQEAAEAAAAEFENDYYIRNVNPQLRTFRVTADAFELPQGSPDAPEQGDWEAFKAHTAEFPNTYWWIERAGDEVVLVEGQWVP